MPSFVDVITGALAKASDVQQIIDALKGTAGKGIPLSLTSVNDAINFALSVKNNDATASKTAVFYKADGTVLFQIDKNGVIASADGVTSASQIPTLTATQTFTNKTLVVPVGAPTTDGALGEAAGGVLNVGNGTASIPFGAYKIAETVLGASAASFDFTGIPATFRHLVLEVMGRGDQAVVSNSVLARFNNDSGANYNRHYSSFTGAGATAQAEGVAQTSLYIGEFTGANASAGYVGYSVVFIAHYAGTTFNKHVKFQGGVTTPNGAGTSSYASGQGMWASTAAINRITVLPPGASVNWIAGSVATLYGLP